MNLLEWVILGAVLGPGILGLALFSCFFTLAWVANKRNWKWPRDEYFHSPSYFPQVWVHFFEWTGIALLILGLVFLSVHGWFGWACLGLALVMGIMSGLTRPRGFLKEIRKAYYKLSPEEQESYGIHDEQTGSFSRGAYDLIDGKVRPQALVDLDGHNSQFSDSHGEVSAAAYRQAFFDLARRHSLTPFRLFADFFALLPDKGDSSFIENVNAIQKKWKGAFVQVEMPDGQVIRFQSTGLQLGYGNNYDNAELSFNQFRSTNRSLDPILGKNLNQQLERLPDGKLEVLPPRKPGEHGLKYAARVLPKGSVIVGVEFDPRDLPPGFEQRQTSNPLPERHPDELDLRYFLRVFQGSKIIGVEFPERAAVHSVNS
ncbi:MAG: hypothetical protein WBR29_02960 [Gammaproteobacteria bacterium]